MTTPHVSRKRIVTLQLAGFGLSCIGGLTASTQLFAAELAYVEALGGVVWSGTEYSVYWPWQWVIWALKWAETYPQLFEDTMLGCVGGLMVGSVWMVLIKKRLQPDDQPTSHGSSRWARRDEIEDTGLVARPEKADGAVVGRLEDGRLLCDDTNFHSLLWAPTGGGKGVGVVLPTLLTTRRSVIVHDIKGENWEITAPWRSLFSHCIYWNPTSEHSARYNPLREIRRDHNDVRDARNIVEFLANPEGDRKSKDFWTTKAKDLLTAAILHVIYAGEDKSLRGVLTLLRSEDIQKTFERMRTTAHRGDKPHPVVEQAINDLLNSSEKTWQGVLSTTTSFLGLWDDELLARATSGTDFRPQDLQHGKHPVSLYIVVPPNDLDRLAPIIKLMFTQIVARLTENLDPESIQHKLLLLIDELPALGGWDWLESALAYVRGYDIKCLLIAQDLNQLEKAYGPKNAILGNCHIRVAFATNDDHTAQRISSLLGDTTATKETESLSGKRGGFSLENKSESVVEFGRPLLTPGEVGQLPDDEELVFLAGQPPIRAKKVRYYENPHFRAKCGEWNPRFAPLQIGGTDWPDVPPRASDDPFYTTASPSTPAAASDSPDAQAAPRQRQDTPLARPASIEDRDAPTADTSTKDVSTGISAAKDNAPRTDTTPPSKPEPQPATADVEPQDAAAHDSENSSEDAEPLPDDDLLNDIVPDNPASTSTSPSPKSEPASDAHVSIDDL